MIALGLFLMLAFPVYASGGSRFTLPVTITWGQGGLNEDKTYQLALKWDWMKGVPCRTEVRRNIV